MSWAGPPVHLTTDPAKPNISEAMSDFCENSGITMHQIAAGTHWQLGKSSVTANGFLEFLIECALRFIRPMLISLPIVLHKPKWLRTV